MYIKIYAIVERVCIISYSKKIYIKNQSGKGGKKTPSKNTK